MDQVAKMTEMDANKRIISAKFAISFRESVAFLTKICYNIIIVMPFPFFKGDILCLLSSPTAFSKVTAISHRNFYFRKVYAR